MLVSPNSQEDPPPAIIEGDLVKHRLVVYHGTVTLALIGLVALCLVNLATLAAAADNSTRTVQVIDPAIRTTAFTLDIPSNWNFVGTILRPAGCHAPAVPSDGLSYTALSPDGVTAVMQLPGVQWDWASDGSSPHGPKCGTVNINTAAGFLLNIALPNTHPTATILGFVPLTPQMQQGLDTQRRNLAAQASQTVRNTIDTARVRIEYELNGRTVDEQLGTVISCREASFPAYPEMRRLARTQRTCNSHGIYVKRALKGHLDDLVAMNLPNAQVNQQWDAEVSRRMRAAFAAFQKASNDQFQSIQDHYKQVTASMQQRGKEFNDNLALSTQHALEADRNTVNATSHMAHQQVLDSLNRQDFIDPTTGRKIETSNQFTHNWISSDKSEVVLNKDGAFDPNGVIDPVRQSWTELIPAN
jgi:hypothetical protein